MQISSKKPNSQAKPNQRVQPNQNKKTNKSPKPLEINQNKGKITPKNVSSTEIKQKSSTSIPASKNPINDRNLKQPRMLTNEADFDDNEEERKESAYFPMNSYENPMSFQSNFNEKTNKIPENNLNFNQKPINLGKFPEKTAQMPNNFLNLNEKTMSPTNIFEKTKPTHLNLERSQDKPAKNQEKFQIVEKSQNLRGDLKEEIKYQENLKKPEFPQSFENPRSKQKIEDPSPKFDVPNQKFENKFKMEERHEEVNKENKMIPSGGLYDNLTKRQILQKLTDKIYILTDELDKLSKITNLSMEDNRTWKSRYAKLKDLYIKNVDEDFNPEIYFEGADYSIDFKSETKNEKKGSDEKINQINVENQKLSKLMKSTQDNIEEVKQKINNSKKNYKENTQKLKEIEIGYQNKIKILQNELEILKTEQNNKNKGGFSEEKYEKLLKNFLELKNEKDQVENAFQRKIQEIEKNEGFSSNYIPVEETDEKPAIKEKLKNMTTKNEEKEQKKLVKTTTTGGKKPIVGNKK